MSEMIFDEETGEFRKRTLTNSQVLGFIAQYWRRRPWLLPCLRRNLLRAHAYG